MMDMYDDLNADRAAVEIKQKLDADENAYNKSMDTIDLFRGYVRAITSSDDNFDIFKNYVPPVVNRFLSFSPDMVLQADEMNIRSYLPKDVQFQFLRSTIEKKYRKTQWIKKTTDDRINLIMEVYKYSYEKAKAVVNIFTEQQFQELEQSQNKGGISDD